MKPLMIVPRRMKGAPSTRIERKRNEKSGSQGSRNTEGRSKALGGTLPVFSTGEVVVKMPRGFTQETGMAF